MNKQQVLNLMYDKYYHTINDLRYNQKIGIMFSKEEFQSLWRRLWRKEEAI